MNQPDMNRRTVDRCLGRAEAALQLGEDFIAQQEHLVAELQRNHKAFNSAKEFLEKFRRERDRCIERLDAMKKMALLTPD